MSSQNHVTSHDCTNIFTPSPATTYTLPPDVTVDTVNQATEGTEITSQAKQELLMHHELHILSIFMNHICTEEYKLLKWQKIA